MTNRPGCKAYERGDQWFCDRCRLVWDLNDEDPPECKPVVIDIDVGCDDATVVETVNRDIGFEALRNIRHKLKGGDK